MLRLAPVALAACLLVATAGAFVYTEKLKLTRNPILRPSVDKVFSPVCECETNTATFSFGLRRADRLEVAMVDRGGGVVRELARRRVTPRGRVTFVWDGRDDTGDVVPEGSYRPRVRLLDGRRTITLPNPIRVDVTPPAVEAFAVRPLRFSPDRDGRRDSVVARFRVDEPSVVSLFVDGVRAVRKRGRLEEGSIRWFGAVGGEPLPQGSYELAVHPRDAAGNAGARSAVRRVAIRFVALGRDRIETRVGGRLAVLVATDARRVRWRLGARSGTARPGTLRLDAPQRRGRFTLVVEANGHEARASVLVRPRP